MSDPRAAEPASRDREYRKYSRTALRTPLTMDRHRGFQKSALREAGIQVIDQTDTGGLTVTIAEHGGLLFRGFFDGSEIMIHEC